MNVQGGLVLINTENKPALKIFQTMVSDFSISPPPPPPQTPLHNLKVSDFSISSLPPPFRLLFTTCYMGSANSSSDTRDRAQRLANQIGSNHMTIAIDDMVQATTGIFTLSSAMTPRFKVHGGSSTENLALQNVQARCRMVLSYLYAQLTPWTQGKGG